MPENHRQGRSFPLGATLSPEGVNFSVFSKSATRVELRLFDGAEEAQPARVIRLDPRRHRTYHSRHVFVPGLTAGQLYGYRVRRPPHRTSSSILTERTQVARFSHRTGCAQAGYRGSQVYVARHSHDVCAAIGPVLT
jgi:pullulanase/glycogen debranching enzyme